MSRRGLCLWLSALFLGSGLSFATTCIPEKKINIERVCGVVADVEGAQIPNARVKVEGGTRNGFKREARTNASGEFAINDLPAGDYFFSVMHDNFLTAWRPIRVTRSQGSGSCRKPMRIYLYAAGGCSWVEYGKKRRD